MIRNWLAAALASCLSAFWQGTAANAETLVLKGGTLYASPEASPISDAVVVMSSGVITSVGRAGEVQIPA